MKKHLIMFTFLLVVAALAAVQGTIRLSNASNAAELIRSTDDGISLRYGIEAIDYNEIETAQGTFTELKIKDFTNTNKTGFPRLPLLRQLITVPVGANVIAEITSAQRQTTSLRAYGLEHPVLPRQESVSKSDDISAAEFVINREFYQARGWTDYNAISVEEIGYMRGERLFAVDFSPVRYNPSTGEIEIISSAEVRVDFVGGDIAATQALRERTYSPAFAGVYGNTVVNYQASYRASLNRYPMSYVIITPNNFVSALQPFIDWKKVEGFNVILATTETIGNSANQIKTYLQGLWNNATADNPAPSYLLIVGDVAQVPSNNGQTSGGHITDLTYVRLQGTDYVPEMYFGRFSATTPAEVTNQVNKTLMHEQYTMPSDAYLSEVVMIAGVDSSWSPTHANGQINYGVNNYFNPAHGITSHTYMYPASGSSDNAIIQDVSNGVGYVNYTAHGSETSWADPTFTVSNVNSLQNANEYPVVVGNCCLTSAFDTGVSFAEAWLRGVNKGGVAYIGGTNSTYWDEDYWWGVGHKPPVVGTGSPFIANRTGAYDAVFHDHDEPFADWAATTGAMTFMGNMAVVASNSTRINYYWEIYSVMGDPSLGIYMGIPPVNNANVPQTTFIGLSSMEMTVDPFTYAALSMNGVLKGVGLADASGQLTLSYSPFDAPGTAQLVLTRSRRRPTFINIDVVPNAGPYVMVSAITVNDGNNSIAEAGESVSLDLNLNNVGIQDASNLTATISTGSPYVTFNATSANLPNVNSGANLNVTGVFTAQISPMIPDQTNVQLDFVISDGTNNWNSTRYMMVSAPNVELASTTFADSNGNGYNESGETVVVTVTLQNTGHMVAESGSVALQLNSQYATLENNSFMLPSIGIGNSVPLNFTVTLGAGIPDGTIIPIGFAYTAGMQMVNHAIMLPVGVIAEGFEANNFTTFPWVNTSANPWTIVSGGTNVHSGTYATKSGTIGNNASTTLQVTLNVGSDGNISFWRKVSSENNYDWLKFSIDNTEMGSWSGNQDWTQVTYPVTAGTRTFKWTYSKDVSYASGSDCAWIDDIVFPMSGNANVPMIYLPVTSLAYGEVNSGEEVSEDFVIRNLGNVSLTGSVTVPAAFELSNNGSVLPDSYNYSIPAGGTMLFSLGYSASAPAVINETITITSNDPANAVSIINISLQVVDNDDPSVSPMITKLEANYPNPFNPETTIRFSTKEAGIVSLKVYNLRGQLVRNLVSSNLPAGKHSIVWNGLDNNGNSVSSGVYLYRMDSANYSKTLRMILMK